ncbi:MAG TPA: hypothetical protein VLU25_08480 [Acidobacteriota bacterium]|nr:hypothetical protein [Acidobacteriota bacterium]
MTERHDSENPDSQASRPEQDSGRPRRLDPYLLQSQARTLRQRSAGSVRTAESYEAPMWKKIGTVIVLLVVLGSVMYLLTFGQSRRQLAYQIGGAVEGVRGLSEDRILRLPPPARDDVVADASRVPVVVLGGDENAGVTTTAGEGEQKILYYNTFPEKSDQPRNPTQEEIAPPSKTEDAQKAYQLLLEQSQAALKLSEGQVEGWTFQEWQPVQNNPPRFFIALVAQDADGNTQQLIWEVNTDQSSAVARSQLARELVRQLEN